VAEEQGGATALEVIRKSQPFNPAIFDWRQRDFCHRRGALAHTGPDRRDRSGLPQEARRQLSSPPLTPASEPSVTISVPKYS